MKAILYLFCWLHSESMKLGNLECLSRLLTTSPTRCSCSQLVFCQNKCRFQLSVGAGKTKQRFSICASIGYHGLGLKINH